MAKREIARGIMQVLETTCEIFSASIMTLRESVGMTREETM